MADSHHLDVLQAWFLRQLETELRTVHPRIAAKFDANPPGSDEALTWARKLTFPPIEPWSGLCQATLSVKLGIEEMEYAVNSVGSATSGRAAWFLTSHAWIAIHSVPERLQFLVRKMSRGKRALVARELAKKLDSELQQLLDLQPVGSLRHAAAHGPQQRMDENWLGAPGRHRLWELVALSGEDARDLQESLFDELFTPLVIRQERLTDTSVVIGRVVERICRELWLAATESRPSREQHGH